MSRLRHKPELVIFFFYFVLALFLTWPLITRFRSSIYGLRGDNLGIIWQWWWSKNASLFAAKPSFTPLLGFPFGTAVNTTTIDPLANLIERFLLLFLNEVTVYNLSILTSFFLPGITMYYLVRYLTKDRRPAFFAGVAFMVCTYQTYQAMYYNHLAMIEFMPLYILMMLKFMKIPTLKRAALLSLSGILVAGTSIHYGFYMGIFTITFLIGHFTYKLFARRHMSPGFLVEKSPLRLNKNTLILSLLSLLVVLVVIMPVFSLTVSQTSVPGRWPTSTSPTLYRTPERGSWASALSYEYILPSPSNPVLGWITKRIMKDNTRPFANSLYLGWSVIILSLFGIVLAGRGPRRKKTPPPETDIVSEYQGEQDVEAFRVSLERTEKRAIVWGFLIAGITCFILSLRPFFTIGQTRIPLPSMIYRYVAPWLRWYLRIAIVVILCAIVLASFGLAEILKRIKRVKWQFIVIPFVLIVIIEMIIIPPFRNVDLKKIPTVYNAIEAMPKSTTLAFYPMFEVGYFNLSIIVNYQRTFQKPMLNGANDNSDGEALRRTVYNPYNPETPGILRRFGITNMVFLGEMFEQYEGYEDKETLLKRLNKGLFLEKQFPDTELFGDAYIFKVTASPSLFVPIYQGDITVPHMDSGLITVRHMNNDGVIRILNFTKNDSKATIRIPIGNVAVPHSLLVISNGEILERVNLSDSQEKIITIRNLTIPKEGLLLHLIVKGEKVKTNIAEMPLFGPETVTLKIGDVSITPE